MNPTKGDVHVNTPLTNISIAYLQSAENFVATKVFPNIPVAKQSDRYYTYDRGEFNRDEMEERADATESAGGGYTVDNTPTYFARVYSLHKDVGDQVRANSDSVLSPDRDATNYLTQKALIKKEVIWTAGYFTTSIWTTDITGIATAPSSVQAIFWNRDTGTPIEDIDAGKTAVLESTGFEPNVLVLGRPTYNALKNHPDIVDRVKYGQTPGAPAMGTIDAMKKLFEIEHIYVMNAIKNTAKEGDEAVHSFIGGKNALLCYATPTPGLLTPTAGYTFSWTGYVGAGTMGNRIKRFRMEKNAADRIEIETAFDLKKVSSDLGYFFSAIVE